MTKPRTVRHIIIALIQDREIAYAAALVRSSTAKSRALSSELISKLSHGLRGLPVVLVAQDRHGNNKIFRGPALLTHRARVRHPRSFDWRHFSFSISSKGSWKKCAPRSSPRIRRLIDTGARPQPTAPT